MPAALRPERPLMVFTTRPLLTEKRSEAAAEREVRVRPCLEAEWAMSRVRALERPEYLNAWMFYTRSSSVPLDEHIPSRRKLAAPGCRAANDHRFPVTSRLHPLCSPSTVHHCSSSP